MRERGGDILALVTPKTPSKSHVHPLTAPLRSALRVTVPLSSLLAVVVLAPTALAEIPEGWSDPDDVSILQFLLVLFVLPLTAALVIALLVYAPALIRGEKVTPGSAVEDRWIGGPRTDKGELAAKQTEETGGASARW